MYILDEFLDMAMGNLHENWTSPAHRTVAENALLCNPNCFTMDDLVAGVKAINAIPDDKIRDVTAEDLHQLGINV